MPKRKTSFVTGCTMCCVMCDGNNGHKANSLRDAGRFFANSKKLICESKTMHAIVPYLYWPWWLPISDFVPCPIQVPQLVCVGNKECRGIMLENTPNITSHFSPGSVKSYTPWLFSIWHTFLAWRPCSRDSPDGHLTQICLNLPSWESSLMLTAQNLLGMLRK